MYTFIIEHRIRPSVGYWILPCFFQVQGDRFMDRIEDQSWKDSWCAYDSLFSRLTFVASVEVVTDH